ncbi:hypothetical protein [Streptomyces sp. GSL17-111]|uniref:hypothetical protein n=1 Tax=Streptomyces sp. GSL17-111 TaxID=3121596 RepID=UPI0030F47295
MLQQWRRRRAEGRVRPGDGRELTRFRWWQLPGRALFHLDPADPHAPRYTVDVRHWHNQSSGEVTAQLYRDGRRHAVGRMPVAFPVEGGTIEVAMSRFGVKRCHFVAADSTERQLRPDPRSAEGRRARFARHHPVASRAVKALSVAALLIGTVLLAQEILVPLAALPPVAERFGPVEPLISLPTWLNVALGITAVLAGMERALRLRHHWLLDAAGS